jgi:hypothetical protein
VCYAIGVDKYMEHTMAIEEYNGGILISGDSTRIYQMMVIAAALRLYAKSGMKVNRNYTPNAMMRAATHLTGARFKPRQYLLAADVLEAAARGEAHDHT